MSMNKEWSSNSLIVGGHLLQGLQLIGGFGVWGLGLRVEGLGFGVWGSGFGVVGLRGLRVEGKPIAWLRV